MARRRDRTRREGPPPPQVTDGVLAARAARETARRGLLSAIESGAESEEVADAIAEHGRRNHWREAIEQAMRRAA